MDSRGIPALLTVLSLVALGAMLVPADASGTVFALTVAIFPVALIALGTRRIRRRIRIPLVALGFLLIAATAALGVVPQSRSADDLLGGLPVAAWILLLGFGAGPLVLVVWSYTATFPRDSDGPK